MLPRLTALALPCPEGNLKRRWSREVLARRWEGLLARQGCFVRERVVPVYW